MGFARICFLDATPAQTEGKETPRRCKNVLPRGRKTRVSPTCFVGNILLREIFKIIRGILGFYKNRCLFEDRPGTGKNMKHGAPKVLKEGFGWLPGSPRDCPGRPKVAPNFIFIKGKRWFSRNRQNYVSDKKNMKNNRWTHVVDKRLQKSAPKVPIFEAPPWPECGFC